MASLNSGHAVIPGAPVRAIAFYLPQYHPIPENDAWWGPGYTEWTNVVRARPQFPGHEQPHLPGELGFYDLRVPEVRERQAALARSHGIEGFCYHYYWFAGRRLLERPLDEVHRLGTPDLPFCVCWANENWSRRWDGGDQDVLVAQAHSADDDEALLRSLLPLFADKRYIRIGDRPLFLVYRAGILPDAAATTALWRAICAAEGVAEPYLVAVQSFGLGDPTALGFDAAVEFPPHGVGDDDVSDRVAASDALFTGRIFEYEAFVRRMLSKPPTAYMRFPCVMPAWDNSARRKASASIFVGSSPRLYEQWLRAAVARAQAELPEDRRLVFINAWNEWGEGCHLEPDERYGDAYLDATRTVLAAANTPSHLHTVSVVVRASGHHAGLDEALQTIVEQTYDNIELIVVDDGARDDTARALAAFRARFPAQRVRVLPHGQGGAAAALNDGVQAARGEYVAILDGAGRFHPDRLRVLVRALRDKRARFAFSRCGFIDAAGDAMHPEDPAARTFREKQRRIGDFPAVGYALLDGDVTVSAGNFVFERALFDDVGGFGLLQRFYHWDWALRTLRFADPLFVDSELYQHRILGASLPEADGDLAGVETAALLARFFGDDSGSDEMPRGYPNRRNFGDYHSRFVNDHGYLAYVTGAVPVDAAAR